MVFTTERHKQVLAAGAALAAAILPVISMPAAASTHAGMGAHQVSYRGYRFRVPGGWQVADLSRHPATCVRFDRHVVYLGSPGTQQSCPSGLVGATEAVAIQPAGSHRATESVEDPVAHRITVTAPRITLTASYRSDPGQVLAVLASAGLPVPRLQSPASMASRQLGPASAVPRAATSYTGMGFDACTAPGLAAMQAWLAGSPYRAIGIYIGGSDRACAQPNLTAAWVSLQAAAGWHFIPLYVGPQVAFRGEVTDPVPQAIAAAQDAVVQARLLGFRRGTPIYYDMEYYRPRRSALALAFLTAWASQVHALGYRSGIYSSSTAGVVDLAGNFTNPAYAMPDVIYDAWWNGIADTADPSIPAFAWPNHRRIHQYSGNIDQAYGGIKINIDRDYLDARFGGSGGGSGGGGGATRQASAATASDAAVDAFFTGSDGALWHAGYRPRSGWGSPARLAGPPVSWPSAVTSGTGEVEVFYRGPGDRLRYLESGAGGTWSGPRPVPAGRLGSAPLAVSASDGVIDVFWRGAVDRANLWSIQFRPGQGWSSPVLLATGLASAPSPAVSFSGRVTVFWKGQDGRLWLTFHRQQHGRALPSALAMGRLGSGPHASGQSTGVMDVFWRGIRRAVGRHATFTWAHGWRGPMRIADGLAGPPFLVASSADTESAVWRGAGGGLVYTANEHGTGWRGPVTVPVGHVGGNLFAAGQPSGIIDAFWTEPAGKRPVAHQIPARQCLLDGPRQPRRRRWITRFRGRKSALPGPDRPHDAEIPGCSCAHRLRHAPGHDNVAQVSPGGRPDSAPRAPVL
jgi:hypothetical protein